MVVLSMGTRDFFDPELHPPEFDHIKLLDLDSLRTKQTQSALWCYLPPSLHLCSLGYSSLLLAIGFLSARHPLESVNCLHLLGLAVKPRIPPYHPYTS